MLILIGEEILKRSVSDGRGLNGLSSTRGGRRKALNRSPGSSEPGRRPRSRGRRANETHRTRGPTGRTVGGGSLNGPNQRLSHVPSTSHHSARSFAPRKGTVRRCSVSVPPTGGLAVFTGQRRSGLGRLSAVDTHPSLRDGSNHGHEHTECGSCVCCHGISYEP